MSLLTPYAKDGSCLQGFVYLFAGGSANNIDSPAQTVIGYVPGPGGKAMLYADGHVKWLMNKP